MTVHFICRGNSNRSLIAEAYLKSLQLKSVDVLSSGTVADIHRSENMPRIPHIIEQIDRHGIGKYAKTSPEQLTQQRVDRADLTICMNPKAAEECNQLVRMPHDTIVWNVDDVGEGKRMLQPDDDRYKFVEETYEEIAGNVDKLVQEKGLAS